MDRWMCRRAGRCMSECMEGHWLIYKVFSNQNLEASVAPLLRWGGISKGSGLFCVTLSSRQTWNELEQSRQAGRAQVYILTADRRPGFWTAPGGRSRCPLQLTLQGKRRRKSLGIPLHSIVLWAHLVKAGVSSWGLRPGWSHSMCTDSCGYIKRAGRFLGGPRKPQVEPQEYHRSHCLSMCPRDCLN